MSNKKNGGVIAAGLALFSMFFGAGDLIWPLILGGTYGDKNLYAMIGLLISGVSLPLLGLLSMMLFQGKYTEFFGKIGKVPGFILIFIIQVILGPIGTIPRLYTLAHATLSPYMPGFVNLAIFSVLASLMVFLFTIKRHRVIDIVGLVLCPMLLACLGAILIVGFMSSPPPPEAMAMTTKESFLGGLNVGYNTLDLIASFIFAPFVLSYFVREDEVIESPEKRRLIFKKMIKACSLSAVLLSLMFIGQTYLASYYTPVMPPHAPEERLGAIALYLLGSKGAFFACMAVALSCLTTAIPISVITANYIKDTLSGGKINFYAAAGISLAFATIIANLGFMGIAGMLAPILQILCPGLILLSILNILHKLYEMETRRVPVYAAFAISTLGYFLV
ncbi:MAG: Branched-chain amino acid transport system 2 carrier protein [Chlamydiae bacterium]|nr:Branched-chain amino acid transport system 2 carrier protein [Chlamydiota bacterium]